MANSLGGTLTWQLDVDDSKLRAGLATAKSQVQEFGSSAERATGQASSGFESLGGTVARAVAAFALVETTRRFVDFGVSSAASLQLTSTSMGLLIGNTQQANKVFSDLYQFSRGTPFAFPDVANAGKTLLQYGITAQNVVGITEALGNVVAVTGADYQHLADIYGQVNAAGKVQMFNVQELIRNGVPIMQAMANVTGTSMQQISEAMLKGSLSAEVFDAAMKTIATPDALNQLANTLPTRLSALQGSLRSLAFSLLGIKIDPIKGFVVEAGGLFDQFSNGVATLAKRLRDPDVVNAMAEIGSAVGSVAKVAIPAFLGAITAIGNNLNSIIPALIGVGIGIAALKFGEAIIGIEGFVVALIAGDIAISPFLILIALLGAALGIALGSQITNTVNKLGDVASGSKNAADAVSNGTSDIKNAATNNLGAASKQAQAMAEQLQAISENVLKANRDFQESLASIVQSHQTKIADLKAQISDEKSSFAKAQQDKTDSFNQSQADMKAAHEDTISSTQKQLDDELLKGRFANETHVDDLRSRLQKENDSYTAAVAKNKATYEKDTTNSKEASDDKVSKLQTSLNAETDFMQKHATDLQGIRAADALDEIQKLKQSHADQLASLA